MRSRMLSGSSWRGDQTFDPTSQLGVIAACLTQKLIAAGALVVVQGVKKDVFGLLGCFAHVGTLEVSVSTEQCEFLYKVVSASRKKISLDSQRL